MTVNTGSNHSVGETAGTGTTLASYTTRSPARAMTSSRAGSRAGHSLTGIAVGTGDSGRLHDHQQPRPGHDHGRQGLQRQLAGGAKVDLQIDGTTEKANAIDGDSATKTVNTGNHSVGETEVTGTPLSDYTTSIECVNASDVVVKTGTGASLSGIAVAKGDAITCTFTNSRRPGHDHGRQGLQCGRLPEPRSTCRSTV